MATDSAGRSPKARNQSGEETRDRLLDAALAVVGESGLVGTTARAIARVADVNQALIFYHFGSIDELLLAALQRANDRRIERFRQPLEAVDSLDGLVAVAAELHGNRDDPDWPALSAIVAGWSTTSELGPRVLETLAPWDDLIEGALQRTFAGSPLGQVLPIPLVVRSIAALFLGIELYARLDPTDTSADELFQLLALMAKLAAPLLGAPSIPE